MRAEFWRGRRVLLTGHTGFKGGWLALWLQALGAEVTGLALAPNADQHFFALAAVGRGMASRLGDIRDPGTVQTAMQAAQPEVVLHLAAQALVRASYDDPVGTYATNVMGTAHVLDAARRCGSVRAVLVVTSDKCYENLESEWGYRENDRMGGHDPYSSSKGCAELVTAAWRRSFFAAPEPGRHGAAVATARAGNVIGGGDWAADRLVPDAMRAFLAGTRLEVRHPGAIRPWQHVLEPLGGYLRLAERLVSDGAAHAEAWNFGPAAEEAWPVQAVIERLAGLWGPGAAWRSTAAAGGKHEANTLMLDCSKARRRLGWNPVWTLPTALAATVAWYRAYERRADLRAITLEQIAAYSAAQAAASPEKRLEMGKATA